MSRRRTTSCPSAIPASTSSGRSPARPPSARSSRETPALALARASADLDLLVVGSRSYGPLGAVLLGAVTRRLVELAECPVMVVPRVRDAPLAVALVGGMEAEVDA